MKRIKGILFDLGDTIIDFGRVDIASLFEEGARLTYQYLQSLGLPLPTFAKYHRNQLWAIRWNYLKSRFTRWEFNALELMGKSALRMGHDLSREQMLELAWLWYQPLSRVGKVEDGTGEMLKALRAEGLALGLISNTFVPGEILDRQLGQLGLLDLLPVRVYSCAVGYRKPSRRIFDITLERLGVAADEAVFVGDSIKADIQGAKGAGLVSILKDPLGWHASSKVRPDYCVKSLLELPQIVRKLTSP